MPPSWPMLPLLPRAPEEVIIVTEPSGSRPFIMASLTWSVVRRQTRTTLS